MQGQDLTLKILVIPDTKLNRRSPAEADMR